ncbi:MAG TPA: hypothetical protein VF741_02765 [Candidatus Aquilonibacter sp.]
MLQALLLAAMTGTCPVPAVSHPIAMPVDDRNDRFFATARTLSGVSLLFYIDSGGGGPFMFSDTASRLGQNGKTAQLTFACDGWIPMDAALLIAPASLRSGVVGIDKQMDGLLGGRWLDGHTWTWDYLQRQLWLRAPGDVPSVGADHVVTLHFQTSNGEHTTGFARIEAAIDGTTYSLLLDTGATTEVSAAAQKAGNFPDAPFATSFISKSIADRWHAAHPDWPYIPDAETDTPWHAAMIQVPSVTVGGYTVGPVWFTDRPDANFAKYMSQWMDAPVVGALGGSALKNFRMTVDYRAERAYFERP